MGSAASKSAASGAKSAARQFPSAANIAAQERAAAAAASAARAARESAAGGVGGDFERKERKENLTSSPKLDYLAEQRKLEEQIAKYDEAIQKSKHHGKQPEKVSIHNDWNRETNREQRRTNWATSFFSWRFFLF